jgi:uncharacterized Zn finger protein
MMHCKFCRSQRLEVINVEKATTNSLDLLVCRDCGKVTIH